MERVNKILNIINVPLLIYASYIQNMSWMATLSGFLAGVFLMKLLRGTKTSENEQ